MQFETFSYRNGLEMAESHHQYGVLFSSICNVVGSISEKEIREHFRANHEHKQKSISKSLNSLIGAGLVADGWSKEPRIFGETGYSDSKRDKKWRLDFSRSIEQTSVQDLESQINPTAGIALEVAFNNDGSTAWNLIKPVLSSELNHVKKDLQTGMGVIVTVTEALKKSGGFDNTVGSFDDFKMHLRAMRNLLTVPMVIIGISEFESFEIEVYQDSQNKNRGRIIDR
jgi:hypothetical protein